MTIYLASIGLVLAALVVLGVVLRMRDDARKRKPTEPTEDQVTAALEGALILELSDFEFTRMPK